MVGFAPRGAGRYVLFGEDESSDCTWHEPPADMLAGAPAWRQRDRPDMTRALECAGLNRP